jgi:hypothetical protein
MRSTTLKHLRKLITSHFPTHARSPTVQVNIKNLIDDVQCYQTVRELRWPEWRGIFL